MTHSARVPKVIGTDSEFCNYLDGVSVEGGTGGVAARLLLREVDGPPSGASYQRRSMAWQWTNVHHAAGARYPVATHYTGYGTGEAGGHAWRNPDETYNPRDVGRRYLTNGGCAYEDLQHLEFCLPELLSAREFVAATHASYRFVGDVAKAATSRLSEGCRVMVLANNRDGRVSWGAHFNILTTRSAFAGVADRLYPHGFFLASYQASSILFTGQGKVGSDNGRPWVPFQLSQRADFVETLVAERTTWRRPLINTRDEPHCGNRTAVPELRRLHIISFDHNLQQVANLLKAGVTQIIVAMIEADATPRDLILEDPVDAVLRWTLDPDLRATARLMDTNRRVSVLEHQQLLAERAERFVAAGGCDEYVPDAELIVSYWRETLELLERRDWDRAGRRLDWVLKRSLIERAINEQPDLDWRSPEIRTLDFSYSSIGDESLFMACQDALDPVVSPAEIERLVHRAPENTRAWSRAEVIRLADREGVEIEDIDWDSIVLGSEHGSTPAHRTITLSEPFGHTRRDIENGRPIIDLNDLIERLERNPSRDGAGSADRLIECSSKSQIP